MLSWSEGQVCSAACELRGIIYSKHREIAETSFDQRYRVSETQSGLWFPVRPLWKAPLAVAARSSDVLVANTFIAILILEISKSEPKAKRSRVIRAP